MHGWLSTGEVESGSTARIWVSPERARWVREDHPGATELSDGAVIFERTYAVVRVARPRDPQGGRRRRGARAGGGAPRRAGGRGAACRHGVARSRCPTRRCATSSPRRWSCSAPRTGRAASPHMVPLWFVGDARELRGWTYAKSQKARNLERDPRATLGIEDGVQYHELRGVMFECDVRLARDPEDVERFGLELFDRYAGGLNDDIRAMVAEQAQKRVGLTFVPTRTVSWDHRKLGGVYSVRDEGTDSLRRQGHAPSAAHPHEREAARARGQQARALLRHRGDGRGRDRGGGDHHRPRDGRRDPRGRRRRLALRRAHRVHRAGCAAGAGPCGPDRRGVPRRLAVRDVPRRQPAARRDRRRWWRRSAPRSPTR